MKTDTAQIRHVAAIIRNERQITKQYDYLFEAYEKKRRETYALRAELSECHSQSNDYQQANIKSWTLYENEQKETKLLRKKLTSSRVKGIAWLILTGAAGITLGKVL